MSRAGREANEALGTRREREAEPMGVWGRGPRTNGCGGGPGAGHSARAVRGWGRRRRSGSGWPRCTGAPRCPRGCGCTTAGPPATSRYRGHGGDGSAGGARLVPADRRVPAGCGGSGVPGTASRRRLARLRLPRAARRGAAARRGLWHRARGVGGTGGTGRAGRAWGNGTGRGWGWG